MLEARQPVHIPEENETLTRWSHLLRMLQIEEDTDRDRYMSPLESKQYGIIDTIIGGDEAGFVIQGDTRNR